MTAAPRRRSDVAGLALTWLGGGIAARLLIPLLGLTSLAWSVASGDASGGAGVFVGHEGTSMAGLGVVMVAPGGLMLGSMLRLWARRGG